MALVKTLAEFVAELPHSVQLGGKSESARLALAGAAADWLAEHE